MNTKSVALQSLVVEGITYVPQGSQEPKPNGKRAVVVVDRGWVFAGDVEDVGGRIKISRALHINRWESVGFDGMLKDPGSPKVFMKSVSDVDIPAGSEIFRVPVSDNWGIK